MTETTLASPRPVTPLPRRSAWKRFTYLVGDRVAPTTIRVLMWVWVIVNLALVAWIALTSLKPNDKVFDFAALPTNPAWDNYARAWDGYAFGDAFLNTVVIAALSAALCVAVSAPAAYALSRTQLRRASFLTSYLVLGMSIPHQAVLVPYVLANKKVSEFMTWYVTGAWDPRITVIVIYLVFAVPFTVFVLTGFFQSMPSELEEAAALDGAGGFRVFFRIMLPMARSGISTVFVLNLITAWNEVLLILVLIFDPTKRTLGTTLMNAYAALQNTGDWAALFAGVVIVIAPMLLLYSWLGTRIIKGMSAGIGK